MGADAGELALTGSTTDGVNDVLGALDLGPRRRGADQRRGAPGRAGAARRRCASAAGSRCASLPFDELPAAVGPATRLVACSHVSWHTGRSSTPAALAATDALVLLDGAQGLGAVPIDVAVLGCDFYAASGQKWLCGPERAGLPLRARGAGLAADPAAWPGYASLADATRALELDLHPDARRFDDRLPGAAPRRLGAGGARRARGRRLGGRARPRARRARGDAGRAARRAQVRPRGRLDAGRLGGGRPARTRLLRLRPRGLRGARPARARGTVRASVGAWSSEDDGSPGLGRAHLFVSTTIAEDDRRPARRATPISARAAP